MSDTRILAIPNLNSSLEKTLASPEWKQLEIDFNQAKRIVIFGNGGNLAVADHAAIDISRLTDKLGLCPGSGILASSLINDKGHDKWLSTWVEISARGLSKDVLRKTLFIGISSSGKSENVVSALNLASSMQSRCWLITASSLKTKQSINFNFCKLELKEYHTAEVLTLLLIYQLIHSAGFDCPPISEASKDSAKTFDFQHK